MKKTSPSLYLTSSQNQNLNERTYSRLSSRSSNPFDEDIEQYETKQPVRIPFSTQTNSSQKVSSKNPFDEDLEECQGYKEIEMTLSPMNTQTKVNGIESNRESSQKNIRESLEEKKEIENPSIRVYTEEENRIIRFLVSKRVFRYPDSSEGWCSNYVNYIKNNHPFFSIFFVHPLHPFGRRERFLVFLNGIFFAIFISFVFFETYYVPRVSLLDAIILLLYL
jgi:hypothetical protein